MRMAPLFVLTAILTGCATTSDVMDTGNGTYMITARAARIRGGTTGANSAAYADANKYCSERFSGTHAILIEQNERDVYQSSFNGNRYGITGSTSAAGNASLRFRCGQ